MHRKLLSVPNTNFPKGRSKWKGWAVMVHELALGTSVVQNARSFCCNRVSHQLPGAAWRGARESGNTSSVHGWNWGGLRSFSAGIGGEPGDRNVHIFDQKLKARHRDRAAHLPPGKNFLLQEVTERLLDRLEDTTYKFPTVLNLGGALENVRQQLGTRGGVKNLIQMDMSDGMVQRSREAASQSAQDGLNLDFIVGPEESVRSLVGEGKLDAVISCLGLHWVNDLPGAMTQCREALKPDGFFLAAMFGGETLRELRISCSIAELEREGGVSPRISPFARVRDAGNLLGRAGFALPLVDVDEITIQYPSALELVEHLRMMGEGNAVAARRQVLGRDTALATAAVYQSMFGEEDGSVPATFQIIYMTGWSPHSSQQRPRQRGTANISFHDLKAAIDKGGGRGEGREEVRGALEGEAPLEHGQGESSDGQRSEVEEESRDKNVGEGGKEVPPKGENQSGKDKSDGRIEKQLPSGSWWTLE